MKDYVVVIGAANIDIGGQPINPLVYKDSNPGEISIGFGGVGRNIAHNLSLLNVPVKMFSTVGGDALGSDMVKNCKSLGMDTDNILVKEDETSSMYMFINDEKHDMALALSQVKIDKNLTPEFLSSRIDIINNASIVVIDCNISPEAFTYLANNCLAPIYVDPVSQAQARKIGDNLGHINTIKPNILEAEYLTGIKINNIKDAEKAAEYLLNKGIKKVFLSMGDKGILAADHNEMQIIPSINSSVVCTTGAGDSAMAAIVWSYFNNKNDKIYASKAANAAASLTLEVQETINSELNEKLLLERMEKSYE